MGPWRTRSPSCSKRSATGTSSISQKSVTERPVARRCGTTIAGKIAHSVHQNQVLRPPERTGRILRTVLVRSFVYYARGPWLRPLVSGFGGYGRHLIVTVSMMVPPHRS